MTKRRDFLKKAGAATGGAVAATTLGAPYVKAAKTIKWRLQTYAGPALAAPAQPFDNTSKLCAEQTARVERLEGIPRHLLRAISVAESGRGNPPARQLLPGRGP